MSERLSSQDRFSSPKDPSGALMRWARAAALLLLALPACKTEGCFSPALDEQELRAIQEDAATWEKDAENMKRSEKEWEAKSRDLKARLERLEKQGLLKKRETR